LSKSDPDQEKTIDPDDDTGDPPPILGSWGRLYALVLINLVVIILLLVWLTETAR